MQEIEKFFEVGPDGPGQQRPQDPDASRWELKDKPRAEGRPLDIESLDIGEAMMNGDFEISKLGGR